MDCEKSKLQCDQGEHGDADWNKPELDWCNRRSQYDTAVDLNCRLHRHGTCTSGCTYADDQEHKEYYDPQHSCRIVASADFRIVEVSDFPFTVAVADVRVNVIPQAANENVRP